MVTKEIIESVWENDRINGEGFYTDEKGHRVPAIWHMDMMIPRGRQSSRCHDLAYCSFFYMICAITMIILAYTINGYCLIALPVCWLINCCESICCAKTLKYT